MRTLNVQKKQVLFAALLLTLGASKSWLMTSTAGTAELAQNAPAPATAPATRAAAPAASAIAAVAAPVAPASFTPKVFKVKADGTMTIKADGRSSREETKAVSEEVTVTIRRETTTATVITRDGREETKQVHKMVASFESSTRKNLKPRDVTPNAQGEIVLNDDTAKKLADESLAVALKEDEVAEIEARKHRGNLAQREKRAETCDIRIGDRNDQRRDVRLHGAEKITCLADRIEAEGIESESAEFARVTRAVNEELNRMIFSQDADTRAEAMELLGTLGEQFDNEKLENYFFGIENGLASVGMARDIELMNADIELLKQYGENSPQGKMAKMRLEMARQRYATAQFSNPRDPSISGLSAIRNTMVSKLQSAIANPSAYLAQHSDSIFDDNSSTPGLRFAVREEVPGMSAFPSLTFTGLEGHRGIYDGTRQSNGADPRLDPSLQPRPMFGQNGQPNGMQDPRFAQRPGFNPNVPWTQQRGQQRMTGR